MAPEAFESERVQAQKRAPNRLKRARGQLNAVICAVEKGRRCNDIVTQLAMMNFALQRAGFSATSPTMHDCAGNKERTSGDVEVRFKELEKFFLSLF